MRLQRNAWATRDQNAVIASSRMTFGQGIAEAGIRLPAPVRHPPERNSVTEAADVVRAIKHPLPAHLLLAI